MDIFNSTVNSGLSVFDQGLPSQLLKLALVLYGGLAAPTLPISVSKHFSNTYVRVAFGALIVWTSQGDPALAILLAVVYFASLHYSTQNAIKHVASTGEVTPTVSVIIRGGEGPSVKPDAASAAEENQMKQSVSSGTFNPSMSIVRQVQQEAKGFTTIPQATIDSLPASGVPALPQGSLSTTPSGVGADKTALTVSGTPDVPSGYDSTAHAGMAHVPQ